MKKAVAFLFLILVLSVLAVAQTSDNAKVEKAYSCLEGKVKDKCSSLTVEEQAFSLLALASTNVKSECETALSSNSKSNECWPKDSCKLRETSLAVLAMDNINKNTDKAESWLLSQNTTPSDLIWYLEIDSESATQCKIVYDDKTSTINIGDDKKIDKSAGSCLVLAQSNYWLQITSTCVNKKFTVSCDRQFSSTLLYRKKNSDTIYVSSQTEQAAASGTTEQQVNAFCFKQGTSCNYEGSLWTSLALEKTGHDTSSFQPYLIAFASDNEKFSPYSFLYIITSDDEYFTKIKNSQSLAGYWDFSSSYKRLYDTSLVMLSLEDADKADAKTWLLENQQEPGCWNNNVRDTAFILYSAWNKPYEGGDDGGGISRCTNYGFFCTSPGECEDAEGNQLDDYYCDGTKICCDKEPTQPTCLEQGGKVCNNDEECEGDEVPASDASNCCRGSCVKVEEPECEKVDYLCRSSCFSGEEEKPYDCTGSDVCCGEKIQQGNYWWLWLLIILIILVVIGIIFRDRLRVLLFKIKRKFRKGPPVRETRPPFPPMPQMTRPRFMPPSGRQQARPKSKLDQELEETLRKLKEMGK